jgi:DNA-binding transcriptional LysR family regulator
MSLNPPSANWFVRSRLKMRQIVLLVHLDEERSVLRAAEACDITQPAASKLLRELEDALGVPLFERHARGIQPTWYGEILIRHARSMLTGAHRAYDEIVALKSGLFGQVSVGTVADPSTDLVPRAIALLKQRQPGTLVSVELDSSRPLMAKLRNGDMDIVIGRVTRSEAGAELTVEPLADERHAVVASAGHPLASRTGLVLEDLGEQGWILPAPESVVRERLTAAFLQRGLPLPINVVQTGALTVIAGLLRALPMVAMLPEGLARMVCESGEFAVLLEDVPVELGPFGIVTRRDSRLSPAAQAMLRALRETAKGIYDALPD